MRGRMDFVNSFMSLTTKQSPCGPQETTWAQEVSSSILCGVSGRVKRAGAGDALVELLDKVRCGGHAVLALVLDIVVL